jgi:hypothetical protein
MPVLPNSGWAEAPTQMPVPGADRRTVYDFRCPGTPNVSVY